MQPEAFLKRVTEVHEMALDCANFASFAARPLSFVTELLGADSSVVLTVERAGSDIYEPHARATVDLDLEELQAYLCLYHCHDPLIRFPQGSAAYSRLSAPGNGRFSRLRDICPQERLCRTKYYKEFLKDAGISDLLSFRMTLEPNPGCSVLVGVGFHRRRSGSRFGVEDLVRARLIAPVLSSSLSRLVMAERVCVLDLAVKSAFRGAASARRIFVLDRQFNCQLRLGNDIGDDAIPISELQRACRDLAKAGRNSFAAAAEVVGEKRSFSVSIERVACGPGEYFLITEAPARHRSPSDHVKQSWRLTPRELEVVNEVCKGARNAEIAQTLGISLKTVENHVSTILRKAHVSSRAELISILANSTFLN